jgi:glycerol-3-phosphate dehydrogenase
MTVICIDAGAPVAAPVPGAEHYLAAEPRYAVTYEGARTLDDVLARHTRISIETVDGGLQAAPSAASIIAPALGWDLARQMRECAEYRDRLPAVLAGAP